MLSKLAFRNIQRSIRDYAIYFFTLLVAVTIFYAFNSINDQNVLKQISESGHSNIIEFTGVMMGVFSIVVALVLGFLVIYANQLLIARRKREFGIYLTLGMKPGQVSRILLYETILVGAGSLVLGLALGVLISQLLSFATAGLFGIEMPDFQFEFSPTAFFTTVASFAAIYVVVAIFNVITVRRQKLIDLIRAEGKSQKVILRNPWLCLVVFVVSIVIIGLSYWQLSLNGMVLMFDDEFKRATVLMLVGTLLFFFSLSGLVVAIVTKAKRFYYKKIRPFTTRQVASKINTSFASIWVVCVLLFFAITTFATGMGLVEAFTGDIQAANPYDASVIASSQRVVYHDGQREYEPVDADVTRTEQLLKERVPNWDELFEGSVQVERYLLPDLKYGDVMDATGATVNTASSETVTNLPVEVVGVSQFNRLLELAGKPTVSIDDDQYLIANNMAASEDVANAMLQQRYVLETPVGPLHVTGEINDAQLYDYDILSTSAQMIVPDRVIEALAAQGQPDDVIVNVMYRPGMEEQAEKLFETETFLDLNIAGVGNWLTRENLVNQAMGLRVLITYLAIYIGLVLLVATAAVLAIQLLSLTIDSLGRYRRLSQLGCDARMLKRSLFAQVCIYFAAPLALAVCHCACAIKIISDSLFSMIGSNILPSIGMAAGLVVAIYGGYMLITYATSKATIRPVIS